MHTCWRRGRRGEEREERRGGREGRRGGGGREGGEEGRGGEEGEGEREGRKGGEERRGRGREYMKLSKGMYNVLLAPEVVSKNGFKVCIYNPNLIIKEYSITVCIQMVVRGQGVRDGGGGVGVGVGGGAGHMSQDTGMRDL